MWLGWALLAGWMWWRAEKSRREASRLRFLLMQQGASQGLTITGPDGRALEVRCPSCRRPL